MEWLESMQIHRTFICIIKYMCESYENVFSSKNIYSRAFILCSPFASFRSYLISKNRALIYGQRKLCVRFEHHRAMLSIRQIRAEALVHYIFYTFGMHVIFPFPRWNKIYGHKAALCTFFSLEDRTWRWRCEIPA